MLVHSPTADEPAMFRDAMQPAVKKWLADERGGDAARIEALDAAAGAASE